MPTIIAALSPCLAGCAGAEPPPPVTNVILISIDTLRPDRLGLHGYDRPVSPHLDALGAAGVTFDQAIAQSPWTLPSHASMLTSLYPSVVKVGGFHNPGRLSPAVMTLAEVFREAGFRTAAATGGGFVVPELGFDQGFELFATFDLMRKNVEWAEEWMATAGERPFFLFLHTYEVHQYDPVEPFRSQFVRPYDGELTEVRVARLVQLYKKRPRVAQFDEADWRYVNDLYDGGVASVDAQIGALMAFLDRAGLRDETLVVVTSDHGEEFGEHGYSGHGYTLFDENVRVPLLLGHPSLTPMRVPDQVRLLDLAPTILDLAGLDAPAEYQGTSLVPFMHGSGRALPAYSESAHRPLKSVRTPDYKYIVSTDEPQRRMYELPTDPGEQHNVLGEIMESRESLIRGEMLEWVETNEASRGRRGTQTADIGEDLMQQLGALGYLGGTEGIPKVEADEWIELLRSR